MFKFTVKNVFIAFTFLLVQICICDFTFADFVVGLEGVKNSKDIVELQGAGFNCVTVSSTLDKVSAKTLSADFVKNGIAVVPSSQKYANINLCSTKKQLLKKDELRFLSYKAIIGGAVGIFYNKCYFGDKPVYEQFSKDWENVFETVSEMSFVAEIIDKGNKIQNPFDIPAPLEAVSYQYGGIKYTFIINSTEERQTLPAQFFQPNFDVVGEKHSALKKLIRNSKNNFKQNKVFVFRYE